MQQVRCHDSIALASSLSFPVTNQIVTNMSLTLAFLCLFYLSLYPSYLFSFFQNNLHPLPSHCFTNSVSHPASTWSIMPNNAINVNGNHVVNGRKADIGITTHGSDWYFVRSSSPPSSVHWSIKAVTAVMFVATLAFIGLSFTKPRPHRLFHYITAAITLVASIAYFTMGSDLGQTPIGVQYVRNNPKVHGFNREIFYARYIDWWVPSRVEEAGWLFRVITTPLLLLDLLLTAGLPWPTILYTILIDEVMIITGLIGALVQSSYKVFNSMRIHL